MKERIKQLIQNKYVLAGIIAAIALIVIIILLLTSKNCSGSKKDDKKAVNAKVTTTSKEKKTTKKEDSETTEGETTTSVEETTLPVESSEEMSTTNPQEANNQASGQSAVHNPATQSAAQSPVQQPATENPQTQPPAQPVNPVQPTTTAQPTTEAGQRTRNTSLENEVWKNFSIDVNLYSGNGGFQMSTFYGELRGIGIKFCRGEYSSSETIKRLSEKSIRVTDSGKPRTVEAMWQGTDAVVEDVTGKTAAQIKQQILDCMIRKCAENGESFTGEQLDNLIHSWQMFMYFEIYDEADGTRKMHLAFSCTFEKNE